MNLNATLIAQTIVFFLLAGFTMKFVWPPLIKALDERAKKIADGLAAAIDNRLSRRIRVLLAEIQADDLGTLGAQRPSNLKRSCQCKPR